MSIDDLLYEQEREHVDSDSNCKTETETETETENENEDDALAFLDEENAKLTILNSLDAQRYGFDTPSALAPALKDNGFEPVPIGANGVPLVKEFYTKTFGYAEISRWLETYPTCSSIAVVCGNDIAPNRLCALDIDIDNEEVRTRIIATISRIIDTDPSQFAIRGRTGSSRVALFFKAAEDVVRKRRKSDIWEERKLREGFVEERNIIADNTFSDLEAFGIDGTSVSGSVIDVLSTPIVEDGNESDIIIKKHRVEFIAEGLVTVAGSHRNEKDSKYIFSKLGKSLLKNDYNELPTITNRNVSDLFTELPSIMATGWVRVKDTEVSEGKLHSRKRKTKGGIEGHQGLASPPYTEEDIAWIESVVDGSDRLHWMDMMFCYHAHYNGSQEGFERFDAWAKRFPGYGGKKDQLYQYHSCDTNREFDFGWMKARLKKAEVDKKRRGVADYNYTTIPMFDDLSQQLDWMLDNLIYIDVEQRVANKNKHGKESILKASELKSSMSNCEYDVVTVTPTGRQSVKSVNAFNKWLSHRNRITAHGVNYVPGGAKCLMGDSITNTNTGYYNLYMPPIVSNTKDDTYLPYFLDHMKYIFPNGGDEWMLNWMAQLVQRPWERFRVAPFSISLNEGTGRGWLTELMHRLVGFDNSKTLRDIAEIVRPGAKSGYLVNSVLVVVNEVYVKGRESYALMSQLKSLLSDDIQDVDVKYDKQTYNQLIYTRFFFQSNFIGGLSIEDGDTRIQPFINRSPPKSQAYYNNLYRLLDKTSRAEDNPFISQVWSYLKRQKVDDTYLTRSIDTEDKRQVIAATKSITHLAYLEFKILMGNKSIFTDNMFYTFVNRFVRHNSSTREETGIAEVNDKELNFLIKQTMQRSKVVETSSGKLRIMCFGSFKSGNLREELTKTTELIKVYLKSEDDKAKRLNMSKEEREMLERSKQRKIASMRDKDDRIVQSINDLF